MAQLVTYGFVGVVSNGVAYLTYLAITYVGVPPLAAMTTVYLVAATTAFLGNRQLTFRDDGPIAGAATRYAVAHTVGYTLNATILTVFVHGLGHPHQVVYAVAIVVVACYLYVASAHFVFRTPRTDHHSQQRPGS
jgi:putative flippase GtrA